MFIKILGTGAKGKHKPACLISTSQGNILVDVGLDLFEKVSEEELQKVTDILVTHGHQDAISGTKILNEFLEKSNKRITFHAHQEVIKQIQTRWSKSNTGNYTFKVLSTKKALILNEVQVTPISVYHDKRYPTFAFNFNNAFFYASDMSPAFDKYELKHLENNILMVVDGTCWDKQPDWNNHITVLKQLPYILSLNNKYTLFTGMEDQWPSFDRANKTLSKELASYKKSNPNCGVKEVRVVKEGEKFKIDISTLLHKEEIQKVHGRTSEARGHYHRYYVEHEHGMGKTEQRIGKGPLHIHQIKGWTVQSAHGHTHKLIPDKKSKVKSGGIKMKKEIRLPKDESRPGQIDKLVQSILGVNVFNQSTIEKAIPFYKLAIYSKALDHFLKDKETKIIDLKWGESYKPATYEILETKRDTKERLLVCGYIIVKDKHPMVIRFCPTYTCQFLSIYYKKEDVQYIEKFTADIEKYVKENSYWKNEKITPFGKFLPLSNLKKEDVILESEIFERLDNTVFNFFNNKEKYEKAGVPFKRGVIFSGLPGVGKTLSGKIIMNNVNDATFIWVTAKAFMRLDVSSLFGMARELQPAILFIEDVDRCLYGETLDAIKTQMDGLESNDGILTILSTNFPKQLPKTLIDRPGRFDDVIEFNLPSAQIRYKVLQYYSKKINIENKEMTLKEIAQLSGGLTPAHLKEIIVSAYMNSTAEALTVGDLKRSLDRLKKLHEKFKKLEKSQELSKPAPDVTVNYIRWRIKEPSLFEKKSFRNLTLLESEKIKAIIGKYKSNPNGPTHVQSVLFDKSKWTTEKARKWVKEHKDKLKAEDLGQLFTPGGDYMPLPIAGKPSSKYQYRCPECGFEFESNKAIKKCPICHGKLKSKKSV